MSKKLENKLENKLEILGGYIISRLNHPIMISYDGSNLMLPPRAKKYFSNLSLVENLPKEGCQSMKCEK